MGGLKGGLYRNPNGRTWHFHIKWKGQVLKGDTGHESRTLAKEWLRAYRETLADQAVGLGKPTVRTVRSLLNLWGASTAGALTAKHRDDREDRLTLHLGEWLDLPADLLKNAALDRLRAVYLEGPRRSIGGWNQILRHLHGLYQWAVDREYLDAIPWKPNPGKPQERVEPVVWPELVPAFLAAVDRGRSQDSRTAIRLMLRLGLREDEALGARWEWLDARAGVYRTGDSKSRKVRVIPVPPDLVAYIGAHHTRETAGPILEAPRVAGYTRKPIARAGEAVGIHGLHPHRLRATFASVHFEAGTPLSQIQLMLGHQSPATTLRYIVQRPKDQAESQARVSSLMGQDSDINQTMVQTTPIPPVSANGSHTVPTAEIPNAMIQ